MIIQCSSCSRKFIVKDRDITSQGRMVQCGYCSVTWHQMPTSTPIKTVKQKSINKPSAEMNEDLSVDAIKASDGKTYKFLGSQWAQLFPSGKTGLFAKRNIGKELDKLTGRKRESAAEKRGKKIKKEVDPSSGGLDVDPSSESLDSEKQLPDVYKPKHGLGFFGYIIILTIITLSIVGVLKTFQNELIMYFPETEYIFDKGENIFESMGYIITIIKDLIISY